MVALVAACQPNATPVPGSVATQTITGIVLAVDGTTDTDMSGFTLRTDAGEVLTFSLGRLDLANGGLPAPHLRAHLLSGAPITVTYDVEGTGAVALRYVDAQTPAPTT